MTERKTLVDEADWSAVRKIATTALGSEGGPDAINAAFAELCAKHTQAVALQIICQVVYRETRRSSLVAEAVLAGMILASDDDPKDSPGAGPLH
jgi:hypothetical protein